ncbi:MAG: hypothetical protein K5669_11530 [Lachnospiraceae bacterium]|nr:hypothetical protein [Lachnospiraceae bacterium]
MINILLYEYKRHKKLIIGYLMACIVLSFFAGSIFSRPADNTAVAAEVASSDALLQLNDAVLGDKLNNLAGDYSGAVSISAEPFTALLFLSIVSNINKLAHDPLNLPELPLDKPWVLAIIAVFFVASKFMKSNSTTSVFGICTLGYLEKFLGTVCILAIGIISVVTISTQTSNAVAANLDMLSAGSSLALADAGAGNMVVGALSALFSAVMGFLSLIVNFIIKTVFKGLEALQVILGAVPFVAFLCEFGKAFLVLILCAINVWFPVAGYVLNIIFLIVCILLFRVCYYASKYFENIYFLPFVHKIFSMRDKTTLIPKRVPKRLRTALSEAGIEPGFIIPTFVKRRHRNSILRIRPLRKLYLVHAEDGRTLLFFKKYNRNKNYFLPFESSEEAEIYLRKGLSLYEIYRYIPTEKNMSKRKPVKDFSLVFSKDYISYIDTIISLTGYTDIKQVLADEKAEKKEQKALLREQKAAEHTEKMSKMFSFIKHKKKEV